MISTGFLKTTALVFGILIFVWAMGGIAHLNSAPYRFATWNGGSEVDSAMSFESVRPWVTAPFELLEGAKSDVKRLEHGGQGPDWKFPPLELKKLSQGVSLSTQYVKEGKSSLEWGNHAKYPTISCRTVVHDWKGFSGILISIYSAVATGDVIEIGIQSDAPETYFLDYYRSEFKVDWVGWKEIAIPFSAFTTVGSPVGWQKVDAISFFAKSKWQNPDPRTVLYFDAIKPIASNATYPIAVVKPMAPVAEYLRFSDKQETPVRLNHTLPEIAHPLEAGEPEVQTCYFNASQSRYGYYPKYDPGYVSFDPKGKAYLRNYGVIERMDAAGKWTRFDFYKALENYGHQNGWEGIRIGSRVDPVIRFDNDGDLYLLEEVSRVDANGKEVDAKYRHAILLHSRDRGATWVTYPLPGRSADFEKLDGHNEDCLKRPPVILLSAYKKMGENFGDKNHYLILPEKQKEGTLLVPSPILASKNSLAGPVHSGGGNFVLTQGDKIFYVYGVMPEKPLITEGANVVNGMSREEWLKQIPPIPENHPARLMTFSFHDGKGDFKASDGVPTYIVSYDRKTQKLSDPVFIGYGGKAMDDHNWAAITADSKGILHVVINGHVNPLYYVSSLNPGDITAWSSPIYVPYESGSLIPSYVSYASLNCDKDDNLLCVVRSDSRAYNHRLSVLRKNAGGEWEKEKSLAVPFNSGYHVWYHKVAYDRERNRFFISFYDQSFMANLNRESYAFARFIWPFAEEGLNRWVEKEKKGIPPEGGGPLYTPGSSELVVMLSENAGRSWKFATTPDF